MRLVPALSPVGWFLFGAMVLLIFAYLYFWWMVIKASAHKHVSRENVTNRKLTTSVAYAKRKGNTHRFLIQITTKGGALSVVQRGIDNVLAGVARYPVLQKSTANGSTTQPSSPPGTGAATSISSATRSSQRPRGRSTVVLTKVMEVCA